MNDNSNKLIEIENLHFAYGTDQVLKGSNRPYRLAMCRSGSGDLPPATTRCGHALMAG